MDKVTKYVYEISYTDNKCGDLVRTKVVAESEGDAFDIAAQDDYYFGKLVSMECVGEANCEYCNGTGDVHGFDGEWKGSCTKCAL